MNNKDSALYLLAIRYRTRAQKKGKITGWYGRRGGTAQRKYVCNICDKVIATESARFPRTLTSQAALDEHGQKHIEEHGLADYT
jgi:hypothetical protein